jgi:hypothetical protein
VVAEYLVVGRRGGSRGLGSEKFGTERGGKGQMVDGRPCGPCGLRACGVFGVRAASGGLLG